MKLTTLIILPLLLACAQGFSLVSWIWSKTEEDTANIRLLTDDMPLVSIPYEVMTDDEKFLQEAAKVTDIRITSPLETCQHKVVLNIRTACNTLTEEQLSKLSVNLLNCQSAVEGRTIFPCTDDMSLKQCTTNMDPDTWNAYHLMSNRARAVCHSIRNTQFRALTELTVNKLIQTTRSQIDALSSLKESHDRLQDTTLEAVSTLKEGNNALLNQQKYLHEAQTEANNLVANNLQELRDEKALITSGHSQLSKMTEDIKNRLERASQQLLTQASERHENHKELLQDLSNIQEHARLIWEKIETSTNRIIAQNAEAASQYEETLEKLEKINGTIHFIWNVTESMRTEVDKKLEWLADYIGNTGEQLNKVYRIFLHVSYILIAMLVAAFLHAPFLTRATIMGIIPLNLATYLKYGMNACLDFPSLTFLIFLITAMHFVMLGIHRLIDNNNGHDAVKRVKDTSYPTIHNDNVLFRSSSPLKKKSQTATLTTHTYMVTSASIALLIGLFTQIYNWFTHQWNRCTDNIIQLIQYIGSWSSQNNLTVEELSCSYGPVTKPHDELLFNYDREYPSFSEDSDYETSPSDFDRYNEQRNFIGDARHFLLHRRSPGNSSKNSGSRSSSPNITGSCSALTKSGVKCRSRVQQGRFFCGRHAHGSSNFDD